MLYILKGDSAAAPANQLAASETLASNLGAPACHRRGARLVPRRAQPYCRQVD